MRTKYTEEQVLKTFLGAKEFGEFQHYLKEPSPIKAIVHDYRLGHIKSKRLDCLVSMTTHLNFSGIFTIDDPGVIAGFLMPSLGWQSKELFAIVVLDVKHKIIHSEVISIGTATETLAHPREIFGPAIRYGGARVIVAHNHPSGSLSPSSEDIQLTSQLLDAGKLLGIPVVDHIILGNGDFLSMREKTQLWAGVKE